MVWSWEILPRLSGEKILGLLFIKSNLPRLKLGLFNLFYSFVIPVKLVLDCDRGTRIQSRRDKGLSLSEDSRKGCPYKNRDYGLLARQAGTTYKKGKFSSQSKSKDRVFKLYFNKLGLLTAFSFRLSLTKKM